MKLQYRPGAWPACPEHFEDWHAVTTEPVPGCTFCQIDESERTRLEPFDLDRALERVPVLIGSTYNPHQV